MRKVWSGDDGAPGSGNDYLVAKNNDILGIRLGKVFEGHGPICTHGMADIKYIIHLPALETIMNAQNGEKKGDYKLENINLEFETINGGQISDMASKQFGNGPFLYYPYVQKHSNPIWIKDETHKVITFNLPRNRLRALIILFQEEGNEDSENFANAAIEEVKVSVEGNANQVYNQGIQKSDIYKEAVRFFGDCKHPENNIKEAAFLTNKYTLVIDFRTVNEKNVFNTGRPLMVSQAGVLLEIKEKATTKNLVAHIFSVSDATAFLTNSEATFTLTKSG